MKLTEHKAFELFERYNIPTMKGIILDSKDCIAEKVEKGGLSYPVVIKAQIQVGGRGKAGGIRFAKNGYEAQEIVDSMLFKELKGFKIKQVMVVEKASLVKEWYISIMLDRLTKKPMLIFSAMGGMDIEDTAKSNPEAITKISIDPFISVNDYTVRYLLSKSNAHVEIFSKLYPIVINLFRLFTEYDCMLIEINPLGIDDSGKIIAIDGKVDIDDSALFRLPEILEFREMMRDQEDPLIVATRDLGFMYIPIKEDGNIAVMSNGSGMLMSCIDLITSNRLKVKAALDLGGGATAERIKEAVRILLKTRGIKALFIYIFGGITRCDEVAKGIKEGYEMHEGSLSLIISLEGTNKEIGKRIIKSIDGDVQLVEGPQEGINELAKRRALL